jgi:hypothetical protein
MYNLSYRYGPPPLINAMQTRVIKSDDIIATTIPASLISAVLNDGIESGDVNFDNVEINLENATGASTTVENLNVNTITTSGSYIRFLKDIRMEGKMLFSSSDLIDEDYVVDIKGSLNVTGIKTNIETDQLIIKDNCISIGSDNVSLDNFVNGLYFPKKDNYLGAGSTIDKIGMLSIPYGIFSNNLFGVQQISSKRFEDNKSSIRFSYIISDYDFNTLKTSENEITLEEQAYVNSLNNVTNASSSFYVNIESHNITLHGGNIISGMSKDLNFYLTSQGGIEDNYFSLNLDEGRIDINKSINFTFNDANILASTNIHFKSNASSPIEYFQIGSTANSTFKSLNFLNNGQGDANLVFGGSGIAQDTFSIYHKQSGNDTLNILIDSTTTATNRIEMNSRIVVLGPKTSNYPSITIKNELDKIGGNVSPPESRIYYQQLNLSASSNSDFDFIDTYETTATDIIFTGYIMISDTSTDKHLHIKIEGSYHKGSSSTPTQESNMIVISKKDIELANSSTGGLGEIVIIATPNTTQGSFKLNIENRLSTSFKVMVKLEIIST